MQIHHDLKDNIKALTTTEDETEVVPDGEESLSERIPVPYINPSVSKVAMITTFSDC